ncbi:starch phosphorylase [Peptoclostridium litorale DSM 5388]|uniref:Alpha-1,4 glucan phosphorylase n=1 Tax=Peptoclostridium litorale DSM 5388 TaxID=1121324 RepID=A0A069RG93_PEPLI|nr:glycogen/starch/alpha-glucan phosphorylase [Peptoclostridium litorale]KDR96036.1 glycogen phosphorylase GlgP [Peptoclostridium litorale DSM 5388]SIO06127.1 starch phosphorylase [Peptoclostridium litorale DSM 5388]
MDLSKKRFKSDFINGLMAKRAKSVKEASAWDLYATLGSIVRGYLSKNWVDTNTAYSRIGTKQVYYFSMEFLTGKLLEKHLINLDIIEVCKDGLGELGIDLDEILHVEKDQGLGNGGLGRLAACFLDSMAAIGIPGHGCGIRYKRGFFEQEIVDGYQVERPEKWLAEENIWEIKKPDKSVEVRFWGDVRASSKSGSMEFIHENYEPIIAVPYDTPVVGHTNSTVNTLRLWSAEPARKDFDFSLFNKGNYLKAMEYNYLVESISEMLYPNDSHPEGKLLRLKQEYFLVSAGIQSIVRTFKKNKRPIEEFDEYVSIHINDTHPSLAIPELMRILMDEEGLGWDQAWKITTNTISYTNHTIMAEALEKWPIDMFKSLLPRIYMIVYEINERFCANVWKKYNGDWDRIARMAIIANGYVKMAYLSIVGSHSVNGVARLHTELLEKQELRDFAQFYPNRFNNKTNGITHRRWLLQSNKGLSNLISESIGTEWIKHPRKLRKLEKHIDDSAFLDRLYEIKHQNKIRLANHIKDIYSIDVDPNSIFDIQAKRLHEYKRQLLNVLNIMHIYNKLIENPNMDMTPRTFIFGAKAAPGYDMAKNIIKLINTVADRVNNDIRVRGKLKVVFLENYRVSLSQIMIPAANVSEQISTATKEASGTGNMKFMMNGAITLATLDGANIEIHESVGDENIVLFGLEKDDVLEYYNNGRYIPLDIYNSDVRIKRVVDQLTNGFLGVGNEEFAGIRYALTRDNEPYFILKDFDSYVQAQKRISVLYEDKCKWQKMSLVNIARSGKFSSDETIRRYAADIWNVKPINR